MNIAIIDADLITKKRHRFPNLACMKISSYLKNERNNSVELKTDYENLSDYDRIYISKVFKETVLPEGILESNNIIYGWHRILL